MKYALATTVVIFILVVMMLLQVVVPMITQSLQRMILP